MCNYTCSDDNLHIYHVSLSDVKLQYCVVREVYMMCWSMEPLMRKRSVLTYMATMDT